MVKSDKVRIDQLLVDRNLVESRTRAQALIIAGKVIVGEHRIDKPGTRVSNEAEIRIKGSDHPFVSRGGVKLDGALDVFNLDVSGMTVADVGASTGGFTDCLLQRGAQRVYALDVGRGQLHNKLQQDPRVISIEGINVRYLEADALPEKVDLATFDLSFISLKLILPSLLPHLKPGGNLLALVKPQFEVGKEQVGKGGIIRDPDLRQKAVDGIAEFVREIGLEIVGESQSQLPGVDGNIEIFLLLSTMGVKS
ncbi:MAG: TlyA family RNA methyltransferase [Deltaproteobacteria bacterium]|nr:TlyA family RNA methyltransferase [Deltaproteobacteria bacterium]